MKIRKKVLSELHQRLMLVSELPPVKQETTGLGRETVRTIIQEVPSVQQKKIFME